LLSETRTTQTAAKPVGVHVFKRHQAEAGGKVGLDVTGHATAGEIDLPGLERDPQLRLAGGRRKEWLIAPGRTVIAEELRAKRQFGQPFEIGEINAQPAFTGDIGRRPVELKPACKRIVFSPSRDLREQQHVIIHGEARRHRQGQSGSGLG
jgi:hypothetical protein